MAQFQAFASGVEVNGQTVLAVVAGMSAFGQTSKDILGRHGIQSPTASGWYPQQAWLDAFRDIAKSIGPKTLNQIGRSIPQNAKFLAGIDSVEKALASIDAAYHMNHRGGQIGVYAFRKREVGSGGMPQSVSVRYRQRPDRGDDPAICAGGHHDKSTA